MLWMRGAKKSALKNWQLKTKHGSAFSSLSASSSRDDILSISIIKDSMRRAKMHFEDN